MNESLRVQVFLLFQLFLFKINNAESIDNPSASKALRKKGERGEGSSLVELS